MINVLSAFPAFMGILTDEITEGEVFFVFFWLLFFFKQCKREKDSFKTPASVRDFY